MNLATYDGLKSAVSSFLNRADLVEQVPAFITMAEAKFNRELRVNNMLQRDYTNTTRDYLELPCDWLQHSSIVVTAPAQYKRALDYVSPEEFNDLRNGTPKGTPRVYTIISNSIALLPAPAQSVTLEIAYYEQIPALTAESQSNWLLKRSPDLYLYGSLMNAEPYLMNDERVPLWSAAVGQAIEAMRMESERAMRPSGALAARRRTFG